MIYAAILAGGTGARMGNMDKPKQYLLLNGKPIIIHTIEKFCVNPRFERIIVLCPQNWMLHTQNLINRYLNDHSRIEVIEGGSTRNDTIMNAIRHIKNTGDLNDETILVTHDSVRPFVTHRIIEENIDGAIRYGACDTVVAASDTIVESRDGVVISNIPDRMQMYQGQTPQSFKAEKLMHIFNSLLPEEKEILTDAAKIFVIKGEPVHLVKGEVFNTKITYSYDLEVAEAMIRRENNVEHCI
ncbi:MAG: 2-C-methyl-D-erythritol 4-phosphate cytidylyltransferase [Lachnospiraceae bacterium]|nr:2-C-methyl-D-erythritol 4-phosphate cytidylyltransferase [Lachnospiraceae bacterium]